MLKEIFYNSLKIFQNLQGFVWKTVIIIIKTPEAHNQP